MHGTDDMSRSFYVFLLATLHLLTRRRFLIFSWNYTYRYCCQWASQIPSCHCVHNNSEYIPYKWSEM